jgi:alginate O-acetyltransferase complex protein AlgI
MLGVGSPIGSEPILRSYVLVLVGATTLLAFLEPMLERAAIGRLEQWWHAPWLVRGLTYFAVAVVLVFFGGSTQKFIYFDF